ncbi:MAG: sodium:proton antiporter [Candidatus Eremiobacteraeota bacterium]|nr:sodium:proton antiporter [Candidatus Eremiobacteraeota bacterium]
MHAPLGDLLLLLLAVMAVAIAARYTRVPYTVGLVIVGLAIGAVPGHPHISLTPELVMFVFLPALLFAGAWTYPTTELRRSWLPITLLATLGVLISILVSWYVLVRWAGLPMQTALLFGAIVSPTDPIAVLSIFRSLHTNKRLAAIVEGESLFNDATAVIAFKLTLLASVITTHVSLAIPVMDFLELLGGGIAVGLIVGGAGLLVLRLTDDYLVEAMGTLIAAYGSYFVAEKFHASGLIAAIVAGMFLSRVGSQFGSFSSTRQSVNQLWEFFAFVANSMLFLLVGLAINLSELRDVLILALWGILAVALGRVVTVYGLCNLSSLLGQRVPVAWQHVLSLAGLRGALSMALALSLPSSIAHRDLLIAMVFSVVLFTLVAQGLAIVPALMRLQAAAERASH